MTAKHKIWFVCGVFILFFSITNTAFADSLGQKQNFFVSQSFDLKERDKVSFSLQAISENGYFYLEYEWYNSLPKEQKIIVDKNLNDLQIAFDQTIYPRLTTFYGSEWKPGIDNDKRVTIVFHQMKQGMAGYFNNENEYSKLQSAKSNEREMVFLSTEDIKGNLAKSYLAHEFTHLITFNQKERLRGVVEDVWLNELRAEYSPSFLGYDRPYSNSNLQHRVKTFISAQSDSLTEWQNKEQDYGVISVFGQYLVEHYGQQILADSLQSSKTGIDSINQALKKHNIGRDFNDVFADWATSVFLNNCQPDEIYCYENKNLKKIKVSPSLIFLPSSRAANFSLDYATKPWAGNWYRIIGGEGDLEINFQGSPKTQFKVPFALCKETEDCQVGVLNLDQNQQASISFNNFGAEYLSLTLMPLVEPSVFDFNDGQESYPFSLQVSLKNNKKKEELIAQLLSEIEKLQAQIAAIKSKLALKTMNCGKFEQNLWWGKRGAEVSCLQKFLRDQGPDIYPQGLITGFFGNLTKLAVIRFQEKYASEILRPLGIRKGTGIVGPLTRAKLNQ